MMGDYKHPRPLLLQTCKDPDADTKAGKLKTEVSFSEAESPNTKIQNTKYSKVRQQNRNQGV